MSTGQLAHPGPDALATPQASTERHLAPTALTVALLVLVAYAAFANGAVQSPAEARLQVALAHVPSWTHAHQVLTQHLSAYTQNAGAGAAGTAGLEGVRRGLHLALRR